MFYWELKKCFGQWVGLPVEGICGPVQVQERYQGFLQCITVSQCITGYLDYELTGVIFYWGPYDGEHY